MILTFENVLDARQIAEVLGNLVPDDFVDGSKTAGWHARLVKNNKQLGPASERTTAVRRTLQSAIEQNSEFMRAFRPTKMRPVLVSRYETGMSYGSHVDDAFMGKGSQSRTDLAMTLFLSDPTSYEGGALVIESTYGERRFKLPIGTMVAYPATTLHRVEEVTEGVRLAAVTWAQSVIRDPVQREMLYDLDNARRAIFEKDGKSHAFDLLAKTHANLLRMWSDL
jgi:PKHD-type hydroxylase